MERGWTALTSSPSPRLGEDEETFAFMNSKSEAAAKRKRIIRNSLLAFVGVAVIFGFIGHASRSTSLVAPKTASSNTTSLSSPSGLLSSLWGGAKQEQQCKHVTSADAVWYPDTSIPRTILSTYPRSGNTFTRELIERSSGYITSAIYCNDEELAKTFKGECSSNPFLIKDHFPIYPEQAVPHYWRKYDRVLHVARNPLDSIFSMWNWEKTHGHALRVTNATIDASEREMVIAFAKDYMLHFNYWVNVPLPYHFLRYEDLRFDPVPHVTNMLKFLLPEDQLPSAHDIECACRQDDTEGLAYRPSKTSVFGTWDVYSDEIRQEVLDITELAWCRFGYDKMARDFGVTTHDTCHGSSWDGNTTLHMWQS